MPVIGGNTPCTIKSKIGNDAFGQPMYCNPKPTTCAVLKLETFKQQSTLRPDSGSSRGHADEQVADLHVLLQKHVIVLVDDVIKVADVEFIVASRRVRFDVNGRIDHLEIMGIIK